jgi:uncharacterized protein YcaQ
MNHHVETTTALMRAPRGAYIARVYAEVGERGPLTAGELSDAGTRSGKWWNWSRGKAAVEHLYDAGLVAVAGRRRVERLYDFTERVIPKAVLDAPVPSREDAMKELLCYGAKAYGIDTLTDIVRYFEVDGWRDRLPPGLGWLRPKARRGDARRWAQRRAGALRRCDRSRDGFRHGCDARER